MSNQHCPFCDTKKIIAVGAVAYSQCVLVEHRCTRCGHLFYIDDRRNVSQHLMQDNSRQHWR